MTQQLEALAVANTVRLARAELKREIREGVTSVIDVLADPPGCTLTMRVAELLCTQRGWGDTRSRMLMGSLHLSPLKRVGELTVRQRNELAARLGGATAATAARKDA